MNNMQGHFTVKIRRKDERLSRPGWQTYSGRFTHISGQPQVERRTAKVRLSETDIPPLYHATNTSNDKTAVHIKILPNKPIFVASCMS